MLLHMIFSVQLDRFWSANQWFFGSKQKKIENMTNTALEKSTNSSHAFILDQYKILGTVTHFYSFGRNCLEEICAPAN